MMGLSMTILALTIRVRNRATLSPMRGCDSIKDLKMAVALRGIGGPHSVTQQDYGETCS